MTKPNFARIERAKLADLFDKIGPDQLTLCEGWTTRDLAAHLVVRERRPDAAAGIVIRPLASHMEKVRRAEAARPFETIVARVRKPPRASLAGLPATDRLTNTSEFFIHHEDARRGADGWLPRDLDPGLDAALFAQIRPATRLRLRRFPAQITINSPGYGSISCGAGGPRISVTGDPGELTLFLTGRQRAARVTLEGPAEATAKLREARLGM